MTNIVGFKSIDFCFDKLVDSSTKKNLTDILCPKEGCKCIVFRKNTASLVERDASKLQLPADSLPGNSIVQESQEENNNNFWLVGNIMDFENIGFSKTVNTIKYLSCADCDIGPLGYHDTEQEPNEYVISIQRAKYRLP